MQVVAVGIFEVIEWPDPDKLLIINGSSILYSAAREFLINISNRGPWGGITLPVYSFLDHYNKELAKTSEDLSKVQKPAQAKGSTE